MRGPALPVSKVWDAKRTSATDFFCGTRSRRNRSLARRAALCERDRIDQRSLPHWLANLRIGVEPVPETPVLLAHAHLDAAVIGFARRAYTTVVGGVAGVAVAEAADIVFATVLVRLFGPPHAGHHVPDTRSALSCQRGRSRAVWLAVRTAPGALFCHPFCRRNAAARMPPPLTRVCPAAPSCSSSWLPLPRRGRSRFGVLRRLERWPLSDPRFCLSAAHGRPFEHSLAWPAHCPVA